MKKQKQTKKSYPNNYYAKTPCYVNVDELRKIAKSFPFDADKEVIQKLSDKLNEADNMIDELQDFVIWMKDYLYNLRSDNIQVMMTHDFFDVNIERIQISKNKNIREIIFKEKHRCSLFISKKDVLAFAKEFNLIV